MPSPVEALPCGSRSMISTCSPIAASAVPRLIAVVVLPPPPFWLAIAVTRGAAGLGMGKAGGERNDAGRFRRRRARHVKLVGHGIASRCRAAAVAGRIFGREI